MVFIGLNFSRAGYYTMGEQLDYPSVSHISSVAQVHFENFQRKIKILSNWIQSHNLQGWQLQHCLCNQEGLRVGLQGSCKVSRKYFFSQNLFSEIPGQAHVAVLEPDATNIINVVEGGYEGITTSIQVEGVQLFIFLMQRHSKLSTAWVQLTQPLLTA